MFTKVADTRSTVCDTHNEVTHMSANLLQFTCLHVLGCNGGDTAGAGDTGEVGSQMSSCHSLSKLWF